MHSEYTYYGTVGIWYSITTTRVKLYTPFQAMDFAIPP